MGEKCTVEIKKKLLESSNVFSFYYSHKHNNGQPIWFTLGILEALKGWDQGLKGMCVGEKRKLIIPPALGYGKEGKGNKQFYIFTIALEFSGFRRLKLE